MLLGTGLPPVYSGHNSYWTWGPPPPDRTIVIHVGDWRPTDWSQFFIGCHDVAHIDNGLGIDNGGTVGDAAGERQDEQGLTKHEGIVRCRAGAPPGARQDGPNCRAQLSIRPGMSART